MTTITVGAVIARNYAQWLPGWLHCVDTLTRPPERVVLVTDITDLPDWVDRVLPPSPGFDWPTWHAELFDACDTDYVSWVNADDRYRHHALDDADDWTADVVVFGNAWNGHTWLGNADTESILRVGYNHVPCGSPVRLEAYRRSPGFVDLMPYSDWALWVGLAKTGATFHATGDVRYDYRWHADTPTETEPTRSRIKAWAASL